MKSILLVIVTAISLLFFPNLIFGQAPNLGSTSGFALFTASGAFTNLGPTVVTGDVGNNVGVFTAFPPGTLYGAIYLPGSPVAAQAAADVAVAYGEMSTVTCDYVLGTPFGNGQTITPGVYCQPTAAALNGDITLDGQGNPNAIFIIKIGGALATNTFSNVFLINSASISNVYWQIGGQFDLGDYSVFRGTLIVDGAINLLEGSTLLGRGLSVAGAIGLHSNVVRFVPAAAGIITGDASVCQGQSGVAYSVSPIEDATGYIWTLPAGATIATGTNTNSITVNFSSSASSGVVTVQGTNSSGSGIVSPDFIVAVNTTPATPTASTTVQPNCNVTTGTIVVSAPLGAGYEYSIDGINYQLGTTFAGVAANAAYNVTARNATSTTCISSATIVNVNIIPATPAVPTASVTVQPTCTVVSGTIVITAPLGAGYEYSIDGINYQSGTTFTGVAANASYNVTARNATSITCISAASIVNVNDVPVTPAVPTAGVTIEPTCTVTTGTIVVTAPLGAGVEYSIDGINYQSGTTFSGVAANASYNVTARNTTSTTCVSAAVIVNVNAVPATPAVPTASVTVQPTCSVVSGTIVVTAPLGAGYEYSIDGINYQSGTTFSGVAANTSYNVTARNATNTTCISAASIVNVNDVPTTPAVPTAAVTIEPTCTVTTGTIVVTAPLGAGVEYSIDGIIYQSGTTFSGVAANASYNVTARNTTSITCISAASIVNVNDIPATPAVPTVSVTVQPTCSVNTGTIEVTAPLGAGYEYSIDGINYQSGTTFTGVTANTSYNVTARNSISTTCISAAAIVNVNAVSAAPAAPTASVTIQPTCIIITGTIVVTAPLDAGYEYSIDGINYQSGTTFTGVAANASYNVTVRETLNPACVSLATTVIVNAIPAVPAASGIITGPAVVCQGQTGITYFVSLINGASDYIWILPAGVTITAGANTNSIVVDFSTTASSGTITAQGRNDCGTGTVSTDFVITVNPLPTGTGTIGADVVCQGQSGVIYTVPVIPNATNYIWILPFGVTITAGANTNSITVTFDLTSTSGDITVQGSNSCGVGPVSPNFGVTVNPLPSAAGNLAGTAIVCQGQNGVIYTVPLIANATDYIWTLPVGATITAGLNTNSITVDFSAIALSGNITAQGSNGCGDGTVSANFGVTVNTLPDAATASVTAQPTCSTVTGTIEVTAPLGAAYEYSIDGVNYQASAIFTGVLANASYNVTVRNIIDNSCISAVTSVNVNAAPAVPDVPTTASVTQPTCSIQSGTIVFTAQAGVEYSVGSGFQASATFAGLAPGIYTLSVRNIADNTCITNAASTVTINAIPTGPNVPTTASVTQPTCAIQSGTIVFTAQAGVEYSIGFGFQVSNTFAGLAQGDYTLTVRNITDNTCTTNAASTVTIDAIPTAPTIPTVASVTQPTCAIPTGTIIFTAQAGVEYSVGSGFQASNTFSGLAAGIYTLSVRNNTDNTCTTNAAASVTLIAAPLPSAAGIIAGTSVVCPGQTGVVYTIPAIAGATGYVWTLPAGITITAGLNTNSITVDFSTGASSGNVSVQGSNACGNGTASANFAVAVGLLPGAAGIISGSISICQ